VCLNLRLETEIKHRRRSRRRRRRRNGVVKKHNTCKMYYSEVSQQCPLALTVMAGCV